MCGRRGAGQGHGQRWVEPPRVHDCTISRNVQNASGGDGFAKGKAVSSGSWTQVTVS